MGIALANYLILLFQRFLTRIAHAQNVNKQNLKLSMKFNYKMIASQNKIRIIITEAKVPMLYQQNQLEE